MSSTDGLERWCLEKKNLTTARFKATLAARSAKRGRAQPSVNQKGFSLAGAAERALYKCLPARVKLI